MQEKLEKVLDTAWYTPMHIFVKVETQSSSDIDCKISSHPDQLWIEFTPPRTSEISEKNWSTKAKPFLTSHLWYKAMLKVWRKSWEPFRIYQLTSTANSAIICGIGLDWAWLNIGVISFQSIATCKETHKNKHTQRQIFFTLSCPTKLSTAVVNIITY